MRHRLVGGFLGLVVAAGLISCGQDGPSISGDQLRESIKPVFLTQYQAVGEPDATLGSGGCREVEGEAYDFDCELGVDIGLGATDLWGYAVTVDDSGCWRGRLFLPYGPYTESIEDPGFEDLPQSLRRYRRVASAMRELRGCIGGRE